MAFVDAPFLDVWFLDRPPSPELTERCLLVLDLEERARADAFRTPDLRLQYVGAHALVRSVLSTYALLRPEEWRYAYGPKGQPRLVDPPVDLHFSLSHCGRHAAVAVTVGREVGFDLEEVDPGKDVLGIADRFFTAAEGEALRQCAEPERAERFATLWTVKEAVLKARGVGLASGLVTVEVAPGAGQSVAVVAPEGPWSVRTWAPEPGLRAAVAVRSEAELPVRVFRTDPLGSTAPDPRPGPSRS